MIVIAKMKAKAGNEAELEKWRKERVPHIEKEEGTLIYKIHRLQKDHTEFVFYEKYASEEAVAAHSSASYFKEFFARVAPLLDGKPEISVYEEVTGFIK